MRRLISLKIFYLLIAAVCSLWLTVLTITPPMIPGDWARLDQYGMSFPNSISYSWPSYVLQIALWLAMIGALWWGILRQSDRKLPLSEGATSWKDARWKAVVLFLTAMGFGIRLYSLSRLPLIVDEIGFAAHASDILHGQLVPIFAPGHNENPSVYSWLVAGAIAIFGQNAFAIRLVPLVFGTMSIPAAYVLGREWWSKRVGLLAASFLTTFPAQVFYSRMSLYNIVDPFFALLALAYLARAVPPILRLRQARGQWDLRRYLILAGIMTGIAQYFYHGARMLPILIVIYLLFSIHWKNYKATGKSLGNVFIAAILALSEKIFWIFISFILVSLPRFAPVIVWHLPITGNMEALRLPKDMNGNTLRAILAWVGQPDVSPFWIGRQPLLLWPAMLAFWFGLLLCLWRWRDPRSAVLLLSVAMTTFLGAAILSGAPVYVRYITALPAVVLLVAIGVEKVMVSVRLPITSGGNKSKQFPYVGWALIAVIVLYGLNISLFQHPADAYDRINPGHWEEDLLAKEAVGVPADSAVVLAVSQQFGTDSFYGPLELMSMSDYVAAYGVRHVIVVSRDNPTSLNTSISRLDGQNYVVVRLPW